jgi:hypothetical protein
MKKIILFQFLTFVGYLVAAQQIYTEVLSSSGHSFANGSVYAEWTIGEIVIETLTAEDYLLTQGFHQQLWFQSDDTPVIVELSDVFFFQDQDTCISALETIIVAGGGSVVHLYQGASLRLVAGKSVWLLPGFRVYEGATLHVHIDLEENFCDNPKALPAASPFTELLLLSASDRNQSDLFYLYPNPARAFVQLEWKQETESPAFIKLFSIKGRMLTSQRVPGNQNLMMDLSPYPPGMYVILIVHEDQHYRMKIVKQ